MRPSTNIYYLLLILLLIITNQVYTCYFIQQNWILIVTIHFKKLKVGIADSKEKWYEEENGRLKWSFGCGFPKDLLEADINKIKTKASTSCPSLCYKDKRCTHAIYTKGYCYLKSLKFVDASPKAVIYNNPGGLCGFVVERPVYILWTSYFVMLNVSMITLLP